MAHVPVLLKEVLEYLNPKNGDVVVDATINGGGHSKIILDRIGAKGKLIGIDQDKNALETLISNSQYSTFKKKKNLVLINGNFRNLDELLKNEKIDFLDAILFDFGMSSNQLESLADGIGRGFSFLKDEPLVMSYKWPLDPDDLTAEEIVNHWSEEEIGKILKEYGGERYARRIARKIVSARGEKPIKTTKELVWIVGGGVPPVYRRGRIHFATRTFQALRIAVNNELEAIETGLSKAWKVLRSEGRIVAISFHSLEDRIVKNFFRNAAKDGGGKILTKKPVEPAEDEIRANPRSRSAKLRAIIKI